MGGKWSGLIAEACRYDAEGLWDIEIADGKIVNVEPSVPGRAVLAGEMLRAKGALLLPGLVETHIHLDKAFLSNRMPRPAGSVAEAIAMTAELKSSYTPEDITARSELALDRASRFGVTRLRAHVEIDPIVGLMSLESALDIRRCYADKIGIQLVAFRRKASSVVGNRSSSSRSDAIGS
ncbi:amidohydrolase family protein [Cohnella faecalis]|uniref:Amidohydrolase-related domain-containing protein n=1 Tax=Cohnella faecalis TaxID=2315694 RepID=A0A398CZ10_9BACL|nr:hypothetical protein [Cohnella faecalis]RIE04471.1 hypothetical protein D3H35_07775 [Cohnella faecalis]